MTSPWPVVFINKVRLHADDVLLCPHKFYSRFFDLINMSKDIFGYN